jgi:hypothetical protein
MMNLRFQISLNGRPVCAAGMDQSGVVQIIVEASDWPTELDADGNVTPTPLEQPTCAVDISALTMDDLRMTWPPAHFRAGDEITIRVVEGGPFDPPEVVEPDDDSDQGWDEEAE